MDEKDLAENIERGPPRAVYYRDDKNKEYGVKVESQETLVESEYSADKSNPFREDPFQAIDDLRDDLHNLRVEFERGRETTTNVMEAIQSQQKSIMELLQTLVRQPNTGSQQPRTSSTNSQDQQTSNGEMTAKLTNDAIEITSTDSNVVGLDLARSEESRKSSVCDNNIAQSESKITNNDADSSTYNPDNGQIETIRLASADSDYVTTNRELLPSTESRPTQDDTTAPKYFTAALPQYEETDILHQGSRIAEESVTLGPDHDDVDRQSESIDVQHREKERSKAE